MKNELKRWPLALIALAAFSSPLCAGQPKAEKPTPPAKDNKNPNPNPKDGKDDAPAAPRESDIEARRLLSRAKDQLAGEPDRALKILENILDQYPNSPVRFEVYLVLGRHYVEAHQEDKAVHYLQLMKPMVKDEEKLKPDEKEMFVESLYWTGVAHFQRGQHSQSLPSLRKLTNDYPNTVWANQAFYYIGMCHFSQKNWSKAIEALNLVGTSVDPDSPTIEYVEAGWRFYLKIQDGDLPVLRRLGKEIRVAIETKSGDRETIVCAPLSTQGDVYIGSIATQIAAAKPDDKTLQVIGGDEITTRYTDDNTEEGRNNVMRETKVKVVSTASLNFTLGTFESRSPAAYLAQPLFVLLNDLDKDATANADEVQVKLVTRYEEKNEDEEEELAKDAVKPGERVGKDRKVRLVEALDDAPEKKYKVRDEVVLTLKELGEAPVRSGRFGGSVRVEPLAEGQTVNKADQVLTASLGDEVVATYIDDLHINGRTPREVSMMVNVIGEIESKPKGIQFIVDDPIIKAEDALVDGDAYLELGRIFKSMGLMKGSIEKCDQGLARIEEIIRIKQPIPPALKERAFKLKWDLFLVKDDFKNAINTCRLFNQLFPQSPLVDQALMSIGTIKHESKSFDEAAQIFRELLALPSSQVKPEAQFRLAQALENSPRANKEQWIEQYKLCAERYPESPFAGQSLDKLVDFFMSTKDFAQANDTLERVFQDYPDAEFLDAMLLKWVKVAYSLGDYNKALEKCGKLVADYPSSKLAEQARLLLPKIQAKVKTK